MFLSQTLDEYLENPMGKGSTAIGNRTAIRNDLNNRFEALKLKKDGFEHFQYVKDGIFYFHIRVPSESKRNNKYDVVIALEPPEGSNKVEKTLKNYEFKVFSNCPSFVYTYTYVYDQYGLLIPFLKSKYKDITLESEPKTKNPGEIINYDKSIYFACKFITSSPSLMNLLTLIPQCKDLNVEKFYRGIKTPDDVELEIKKENNRLQNEDADKYKNMSAGAVARMKAAEAQKNVNRAKYWHGRNKKKIPKAKIKPKPKIKPR